jgi:hypothetical protein
MAMSEQAKQVRGFAALSQEERGRIAAMGGRAAHKQGRAHEWTAEEARQAGRKGGNATREKRAEQGAQP